MGLKQEGLDFGDAHLAGVAFMMDQDKAADPVEIGFFGSQGRMLKAERILHQLQEFLGGYVIRPSFMSCNWGRLVLYCSASDGESLYPLSSYWIQILVRILMTRFV